MYYFQDDDYQIEAGIAWSVYQFLGVVSYAMIAEILQQEVEKTNIIVHKLLLSLDCQDNKTLCELKTLIFSK